MFFCVFWDLDQHRRAGLLEEPPAVSLTGKRAVVVEDQMAFQMIVSKILGDAGVQVVGTASDGREGVEVIRREQPDLVLMDTMMPLMDGLDAAERALSERDTCIILLSASQSKENQRRARELGCGFIPKPIMRDTFMDAVGAAYTAYLRRGGQ
jgi:response regulator NasT